MAPLEFLQRLAALVPRPRLHLIRFHGVLAPNSALRAQIVPEKPDHPTVPADDLTDERPPSTQRRLTAQDAQDGEVGRVFYARCERRCVD